MSWEISPAVVGVQLDATMGLANSGSGHSVLLLFTSLKPAPGASAGASPQVVIELANPCAEKVGAVWKLLPREAGGSIVLETGAPLWGRWLSASGEWMGDATVTDPAGTGGIKVSGGATAPGATSPTLYAGGLALLGEVSFA